MPPLNGLTRRQESIKPAEICCAREQPTTELPTPRAVPERYPSPAQHISSRNMDGDMSRATYRPVNGSPALGLLRGLRPATTPSADDELSLGRTTRMAAGSMMAVPMFTVNRLTGSASSCAPAASPRVRRRLSSRPPRQTWLLSDGVASRMNDGGRALLPGPDPPDFEPVRELRGFNHWFTYVTPLCLARRTPAIWQYWPVPALSGLLPPDPASPGSGCPPLHRTAATARRWGPTPHTVQQRLMAHDQALEVARELRARPGERDAFGARAVHRTPQPPAMAVDLKPPDPEIQMPPHRAARPRVLARSSRVPALRTQKPAATQRHINHHPIRLEPNLLHQHPLAEAQKPGKCRRDAHAVPPCKPLTLRQPAACR